MCIGSVIVGGVTLYMHWNRNNLNQHPTLMDAQGQNWTQLPDNQSVFHQMGVSCADDIKFVSPDGYSEAVFDGNGRPVTDPSVYATYTDNAFLHTVFDIVPYMLFGTTPGDMFSPDRFSAAADGVVDRVGDWFGPSPDGDGGGSGGGALGGFGGPDPFACR